MYDLLEKNQYNQPDNILSSFCKSTCSLLSNLLITIENSSELTFLRYNNFDSNFHKFFLTESIDKNLNPEGIKKLMIGFFRHDLLLI